MSAFKSFLDDPKAVGDTYRDQRGGPWFHVTSDAPRKARWFCDAGGCSQWYDPNTNERGGQCPGYCLAF